MWRAVPTFQCGFWWSLWVFFLCKQKRTNTTSPFELHYPTSMMKQSGKKLQHCTLGHLSGLVRVHAEGWEGKQKKEREREREREREIKSVFNAFSEFCLVLFLFSFFHGGERRRKKETKKVSSPRYIDVRVECVSRPVCVRRKKQSTSVSLHLSRLPDCPWTPALPSLLLHLHKMHSPDNMN